MQLTLVQAAQILGISALLLCLRIRHHRLAFVARKPAPVELAAVLKIQDHDGQALIECRAAEMKHPARRMWRPLT